MAKEKVDTDFLPWGKIHFGNPKEPIPSPSSPGTGQCKNLVSLVIPSTRDNHIQYIP